MALGNGHILVYEGPRGDRRGAGAGEGRLSLRCHVAINLELRLSIGSRYLLYFYSILVSTGGGAYLPTHGALRKQIDNDVVANTRS